MFDSMKKGAKKFGAAVVTTVASASAFATGTAPDLTSLTSSVDFSTVTAAVLGVGASLIVVHIAWKGAKMVIAAVRGG